ncbi:hypothetical protein M408DRAFT_323929 [Serendipita vermifera MAFF 305830]|uniref:F-box domain-containing protein n=1 Tax=Serendipita vermifera MAFF 305830 TaxID=933852 RepID=A0A0C2W6X3_SERVB|nr:hypothetical protein M408DRAFT_323929 [Serendipita vermifera MAFF 305830]
MTVAPPITRCPSDILLIIFELIMEESRESATDSVFSPLAPLANSLPAKFALVCRAWKMLVYNTSTFWVDISIEWGWRILIGSKRIKWRASMAKDAPVNLYVTIKLCTVYLDDILYILNVVPNVRRFSVTVLGWDTPLLFEQAWPQLLEVREARYTIYKYKNTCGDLWRHFMGMPKLTTLWLSGSAFQVPYRVDSPVLPVLTCLRLGTDGGYIDAGIIQSTIAALLSHCPLIEELYLDYHPETTTRYRPSAPPFTLTRLYKISTKTMSMMHPFSQGYISTPALREFKFPSWEDSYVARTVKFITANLSTLTTIVVSVTDGIRYQSTLHPLVNITFLELDVFRGEGFYLKALYTPLDSCPSTNQPPSNAYLPSLRTVRLGLHLAPILSTHFELFCTARCIPVNSQRTTQAGYHALDKLQVIRRRSKADVQGAMQTNAWKDAQVLDTGGEYGSFELRWDTPANGI